MKVELQKKIYEYEDVAELFEARNTSSSELTAFNTEHPEAGGDKNSIYHKTYLELKAAHTRLENGYFYRIKPYLAPEGYNENY